MENNLEKIRLEKGLSQQKLAELVGTSGPQVNRLEKGERRLTVDWLMRFAEALDVSPSEIIGVQVNAAAKNAKHERAAREISVACATAISSLIESHKLSEAKAARILEKAITYFWDDFLGGTPPSEGQIKKFMISIVN